MQMPRVGRAREWADGCGQALSAGRLLPVADVGVAVLGAEPRLASGTGVVRWAGSRVYSDRCCCKKQSPNIGSHGTWRKLEGGVLCREACHCNVFGAGKGLLRGESAARSGSCQGRPWPSLSARWAPGGSRISVGVREGCALVNWSVSLMLWPSTFQRDESTQLRYLPAEWRNQGGGKPRA